MKLFGRRSKIDKGAEECGNIAGAVLIDVREADEFASGHIPGARNIPLSRIQAITLPKNTPLYLYCLRGSRSLQAMRILKKMGYTDVRSIGGINSYTGVLKP